MSTPAENVFDQFDKPTGNVFDQFDDEPVSTVAPAGTIKGEAQRVLGGGEAALQLATGAIATPIAGFAGIIAAVAPGGKTGAEAVESAQEALTFQPRTKAA